MLKNNFDTLAFYRSYAGFSNTYKVNEKNYLSEYKRNNWPITTDFDKKNKFCHNTIFKQIGKITYDKSYKICNLNSQNLFLNRKVKKFYLIFTGYF